MEFKTENRKVAEYKAKFCPLGQLEPNLAGMFLGWSSTKSLFFIPVGYSTWLPGPIICSDWLKFQRNSKQKIGKWPNIKRNSALKRKKISSEITVRILEF
jgi:hypothetical protein